MQKNMTDRTPGSYDDFVAYLGTVRTEEELFSRLTYWFAGQNRPEDVLSRSELVEARAKELGFWQGLTFRMERWLTDGKSELEAVGAPSILVPYPYAAENHQYHNGMVLQNAGAALVVEEKDYKKEWLVGEVEKFARYVSLEELLQKADLVSLHCPLTEGTHHMINKDTIAMMRDSAILVNTSRGGLIDTDALIEALRARKFGGVGLDVYEDEDDQVFQDFSDDVLENEVVPVLLSFPNVVITSHQAFFTRTALQSIAAITLENARAFARGEELKNEVKA